MNVRTGLWFLLLAFGLLLPGVVYGQVADVKWLEYTDYQMGVSLEYPADWEVRPRSTILGRVGEALVFTAPSVGGHGVRSVSFSHSMISSPAEGTNLLEWVSRLKKEHALLFGAEEPPSSFYSVKGDFVFVTGETGQEAFVVNGEIVWVISESTAEGGTSRVSVR